MPAHLHLEEEVQSHRFYCDINVPYGTHVQTYIGRREDSKLANFKTML